jgi:hypothetical protein
VVSESELQLYKVNKGVKEILFKQGIKTNKSVFLKYKAQQGRLFRFYWSENGREWQPVALRESEVVDGSFVAQWGYSPRVGLIVDKNTEAPYAKITVKYHL